MNSLMTRCDSIQTEEGVRVGVQIEQGPADDCGEVDGGGDVGSIWEKRSCLVDGVISPSYPSGDSPYLLSRDEPPKLPSEMH